MKKIDRSLRAILRDSGFNLLGQGIPLLVALIAVPSLIRGLGEARFGVLGLVWMFVTFFGEVGVGRAVTRYGALACEEGRANAVRDIARVGARAQLWIGVFLGAVGAVTAPWIIEGPLALSGSFAAETRAAFLWLAIGTPAILAASAYRGGLEAIQRFDLVNLIRGGGSAANFLLPLVALSLGWDIGGVVGVLIASRVAITLLLAGALAHALPRDPADPDQGEVDGLGLWTLLAFSGWTSITAIASPILTYMDRALLGAISGVEAVGRYVPPWEASIRLGLVPASVVTALFPIVSAGGDGRATRGLVLKVSGSILLVTGIPAVILGISATPLLAFWLGDAFHPDGARALQILVGGVVLNSSSFIPIFLLQGAGKPHLPALLHLIEIPIQMVAVWLLVSRFGVIGAAMAWSLRSVVDSICLWIMAFQLLERGEAE